MTPQPPIIDYDDINEWSPWMEKIVSEIASNRLLDKLRQSKPEFIEDARDFLVDAIGRKKLVQHLDQSLQNFSVRVFHGTRVTTAELESIKHNGLRSLRLTSRRESLAKAFEIYPDWQSIEPHLDEQIHRFGVGWQNGGAGKREDGSVHVCLSRAGLLYGCNHYLKHGAEVDQHIAQALFPGRSGLDLLARARAPKIISFTAPYGDAAQAASPYGTHSDEIPALAKVLISAWAYHVAHPTFTVVSQRDTAALRFPAPIEASRIERIETIDEAELLRDSR